MKEFYLSKGEIVFIESFGIQDLNQLLWVIFKQFYNLFSEIICEYEKAVK